MTWPWIFAPLLFVYLYVRLNDHRLSRIPERVLALSPTRARVEDIRRGAAKLRDSPISIADQIPPKTRRRYIVVGGAGFVGGWIVLQLLERGEDPRRIRVVDIRGPVRPDLKAGRAKDVQFIQTDITDAKAVAAAFNAPWPDGDSAAITVFHTAAIIRFYERAKSLLPNSTKVNVTGTQNVVNAARDIGATALVYTSSSSVSVHSSRLFLWPWETEPPRFFVQGINDDDGIIPKTHSDFFSNYAVTKMAAERCVRAADGTASRGGILRTGCLRPGNAIFGPGGDVAWDDFIARKRVPNWYPSVVHNHIYVENAAVAHLLYEQRLVELSSGGKNPDIGGQAFVVTDPGPPSTYSDLHLVLSTLTDTEFPKLSATLLLLFAHAVEWYHLAQSSLGVLPALGGDVVKVQPAMFNLVNAHLILDDSRARLPPEKGGLGYIGAWTTVEGLYKTVELRKRAALPAVTAVI
ncbi:3-beta hydroxysteroid dehydrogenase/isomerase family-domain-containing protein [Mycena galericulata]|nr:3-beta hydroxysteroid dehydrogenase/isomerase family-domain-containing protein [Mycena galericulata]